MNHRSQRQKFRDTSLWKRILERHRFRGRLLPTRVPLVFLRLGQPKELRQPRARSQRNGPPVQLNLYFQLSWPQWLVTRQEPGLVFQTSTFNSTAVRELNWLRSDPRTTKVSATSKAPTTSKAQATLKAPVTAEAPVTAKAALTPKAPVTSKAPTTSTAKTITHRVAPTILGNDETSEPGPAAPKVSFETVRRDDRTRSAPIAEPRVASAPAPASASASAPADRPRVLPPAPGFRKAATVFQLPVTSINNQFRTVSSTRYFFAPRAQSAMSPAQKVQLMAPAGEVHALKTTIVRRSLRHDTVERALRTTAETRSVSSLTVQSQLVHRTRTDDNPSNAWEPPARSRLYTQPAPLTFANQVAAGSAARTESHEQQSPAPARTPPPPVVQPVQQQLDMNRLSEEVYRHIQRKIRIERERRGL